jgi:hypothetical protein
MNSQLTPLKETGIYIVELPIGSHDFIIHGMQRKNHLLYYTKDGDVRNIQLDADYELLGTITSDTAPYLDFVWHKGKKFYLDYNSNNYGAFYGKNPRNWLDTPEASFRSLLNSCGYYFINIMGEKEPEFIGNKEDDDEKEDWAFSCLRLKQYQSHLVIGILLALTKYQ